MEAEMSQTVEQIEAQALGLSPEDRVRLADRLIASVFEDEAIESAWSAEVEKRIAEIDAGRAELIPASEAIARARDAIK
jgi:putative addiction module component (TIGR02574 family)